MTKKSNKSLQVLSEFLDSPEDEQKGLVAIVRTHPLIAGGDAVESLTKGQELFLIAKL